MPFSSVSAEPQAPAQPTGAPAKRRRWVRPAMWVFVGCAALVLCAYTFRAPLLTGMAKAWVVNEPVTRADAIVIPGGGVEDRPFAAAKLFHEGVAPRILYMNVQLDPAEALGIIPPEGEQTRRILSSNNVPESAMTAIGTNVTSTYDESRAVRAWVRKTGAKSVVIVTDLFHTRRARWIFRKELRGTGTAVHAMAVDPVRYRINNWWQHEEGVIAFQNEIIKYLYYRWKY